MKNRIFMKKLVCLSFAFALVVVLMPSLASAATGNAENGAKIYAKKCWWCHGKEGEADGPAAEFLLPPPRDFSAGVYKYKWSVPESELARDEDLFRMMSDGMPGTGMPAWKDILSEQDRWDLVAHIKSLTDMFEDEANPAALPLTGAIKSSKESIEAGSKIFHGKAKCFECHGVRGKGNTMKKLKEESGQIVWPRNLTKPWTFRGGTKVEDIFARVSNGIPNTPMPSFAVGKNKLTEEERWNVANFVKSLADPNNALKGGETVVQGLFVEALPADEKDTAWDAVQGTSYFLVPQIVHKDRFFTPANDLVTVKALYSEKDVAFLMQWDDRTKSVVGDKIAEAITRGALKSDAIAIETPVEIPKTGGAKPYFGHGDGSHSVSMLYWSAGSTEKQNVAAMLTATGVATRKPSDAGAASFSVVGASYDTGTWKVMLKRNLTTPNAETDTQFETGKYIPIAFANWDGSNGESGSKHTMTTWGWLLLKPPTGSEVVVWPLGIFILLIGGQFVAATWLRKQKREG